MGVRDGGGKKEGKDAPPQKKYSIIKEVRGEEMKGKMGGRRG